MPSLKELQETFFLDRPAMADNNNSLERLLELFNGEVAELLEALALFAEDKSEKNRVNVEQESADVYLFLSAIIRLLGGDMDEVVRAKIAYNSDRFRSKDFQTDYQTAYKKAKKKQPEVLPYYYPELGE